MNGWNRNAISVTWFLVFFFIFSIFIYSTVFFPKIRRPSQLRAVEYTHRISADEKDLHPKCPGNNTKPSDDEFPFLEIWGKWSTPSLPLLLSSFWLGVVVSDCVPIMGRIELFEHLTVCQQITDVKLNC